MNDSSKNPQSDEQSPWEEAIEVIDELYVEELSEQHDFANPNSSTLSSISSVATSCGVSTASTIGTGATLG